LEFICPILRLGGACNLLFPVYPGFGPYELFFAPFVAKKRINPQYISWMFANDIQKCLALFILHGMQSALQRRLYLRGVFHPFTIPAKRFADFFISRRWFQIAQGEAVGSGCPTIGVHSKGRPLNRMPALIVVNDN
jgi:hypothetical protein